MHQSITTPSALLIAVFFGIQIIRERDPGILTTPAATPTRAAPRRAGVHHRRLGCNLRP